MRPYIYCICFQTEKQDSLQAHIYDVVFILFMFCGFAKGTVTAIKGLYVFSVLHFQYTVLIFTCSPS